MKKRGGLLFVLALFTAGLLTTTCKKLEENKLENALDNRITALRNGKAGQYLRFFAPDYSDTRLELAGARDRIMTDVGKDPSFEVKIKERKLDIEGDRAIATEDFFFKTTVTGDTRTYNETQHLLLEKRGDGWVCLSGSEILWLLAGRPAEEHSIEQVLLRRENALTGENIKTYMRLISSQYNHQGTDREELRSRILHSFQVYDDINFKSFDRKIYFYGDYATVTQKFNMHALQMGSQKTWSGHERLTLRQTEEGWKIVKGL